jgi:CCR4-NOT transcriptional complex subunit CAF120
MQSTYSESANLNHTSRPEHYSETPHDADADADAPPLATPLSDDDDNSRLNSLQDAFIDQDALERMLSSDDRTGTMHSATSTEPDYASTVSDHEERPPVERPRAGKLKTVGNPDMAQHDPTNGRHDTWQQEQNLHKSSVPNINFGPTYIYKPTGRPGTSGTTGPSPVDDRNRSGSTDRLRSSGRLTPGGISPVENYRQSYFGGVADGDHSRSHSRNPSVAWTPSGGSPGHQQRHSLTPEQWVQQRAAMAAQPQYPPQLAHQRTASSGSFNVQQIRKSMTKTPPPFARARTPSGDWTNMVQDQRTPPSRPHSRGASMHLNSQPLPPSRPHSRSASTHLNNQPLPPSRPLSRSAGMYLNQPNTSAQNLQPAPPSRPLSRSAGAYLNPPSGFLTSNPQSTNLSAREQMHVARATGTPLLDTVADARKKKQQEDESLGLVGAIGAREREKAAMKSGHRSSMVVENAIRARQDQQAEAQMLAYQQQMVAQQQQAAFYAQQQQQQQQQQAAAGYGYGNGYGYAAPTTPGTQYGHVGVQLTPLQMQQQNQSQIWQQQQQQGAQTPGNRQSWFAGSYFGGLPPQ